MRRLRDIFYINAFPENNELVYYGMQLNEFIKYEKSIEIPIYTIGKFLDMDEMYNNLQRSISRARYSAYLVHKNKEWKICYISTK